MLALLPQTACSAIGFVRSVFKCLWQVLAKPNWNALLSVDKLPGTLLGQQFAADLSGEIKTRGSWSKAMLSGDLHSSSDVPAFDLLQTSLDLLASPKQQTLTRFLPTLMMLLG